MKIRTMGSLSVQALRSLKRGSALTCVAIVTACMVLLGTFLIVACNLTELGGQLQSQVQIRAFLTSGMSESARAGVEAAIRAVPGVSNARFVGKQEALERLGKSLADYKSVLSDLTNNPLPESFDVSLVKASDVKAAADAISRISGVSDIRYGQGYVDRLLGVLRIMWGITGVIAALVIIGTSLIVANTLKLSVAARRREIEIMKLVGASDSFILFPFILEGIAIGLVGSALAALLVYGGYYWLSGWVHSAAAFIPMVRDPHRIGQSILLLLLFGAGVGLIGSVITTRRHLRV